MTRAGRAAAGRRRTGRSLTSVQDRFQLWLALLAAYPERRPTVQQSAVQPQD